MSRCYTALRSVDARPSAPPPRTAYQRTENPPRMSSSENPVTPHYRVAILGSGPAGLTAALYASRANLAPIVFEGSQPGGQLTITTDVENYPGFPEGILGPELIEQMREQAKRFGTTVKFETVDAVDLDVRPFRSDRGRQALHRRRADHRDRRHGEAAGPRVRERADGLRRLGLRHLRRLLLQAEGGRGGRRRRHRDGGGDLPHPLRSKVTVIHRRDELRASKIMQERALQEPEDRVRLERGRDRGHRHPRRAASRRSGCATPRPARSASFATQGLFVAIGHEPNTQLFRGKLPMNDVGYLVVEEPTHAHRGPGRLRRRRRRRPQLPPGGDRRRLGLQGGDRRRALARGAGAARRGAGRSDGRLPDPARDPGGPRVSRRPRTLGELRAGGYRPRSVRDEIRANLMTKLAARRAALPRHPRLRADGHPRDRERPPRPATTSSCSACAARRRRASCALLVTSSTRRSRRSPAASSTTTRSRPVSTCGPAPGRRAGRRRADRLAAARGALPREAGDARRHDRRPASATSTRSRRRRAG